MNVENTSITRTSENANGFWRILVRLGLYPATWAVILTGYYFIDTTDKDPRQIWSICVGILAPTYLAIEFLLPYERRWSMTFKSFISDLKYVAVNSIFVSALSALLALFTITIAGRIDGIASDWPIAVQVAACLLVSEACNYSMHRFMHEGRGTIGQFFWRTHSAHHLPPRLYLLMHAVFHPLNGIIIQVFAIILPIWLMGYSPQAVAVFLIINGAHGLISHFNVDVRMGWANYLFVGPELHRYHHSANVDEAKNYGATLSIYDQLFGSFVYCPGKPPAQLGVDESTGLPNYERIFPVLKLPFQRAKS